jgi:hypothetical protein
MDKGNNIKLLIAKIETLVKSDQKAEILSTFGNFKGNNR